MTISPRDTSSYRTNRAGRKHRYPSNDFDLQIPLQRHQRDGATWLLQDGHEKALVADEVGLGKTAMVVATISCLLWRGALPHVGRQRLTRVLWLTDATLLHQTMSELGRFAPHIKAMSATPQDLNRVGWTKERRARFPEGLDVLVMGYETAHSRRHFLSPSHEFSMLVLDEAGKLRSGGAMWRTVREMAQATPRVVGMSATPMENDPVELFNVLAAIDTPDLWTRSVYETEFVEWKGKINRKTGQPYDVKPIGWATTAHSDAVRDYLSRVMLRRTGEQVKLDLPVNVTAEPVVWVDPYEDQQDAYDRASRNPNGARAFHGQQKAGLSTGESSAILDRLVVLLRERGQQQAIVFSEYLDLLDEIAERLTAAGISHAVIHGDVKGGNRESVVRSFVAGKVRVLIGNKVLERGLNLQNCNLLISVGNSWNPAREAQREGRIRRARSDHSQYEHLTLLPTTRLSEAQWATLARKREAALAVGL